VNLEALGPIISMIQIVPSIKKRSLENQIPFLGHAIMKNKIQSANLMLRLGFNSNFSLSKEHYPLQLAVERNLYLLVKNMLRHGANPDL